MILVMTQLSIINYILYGKNTYITPIKVTIIIYFLDPNTIVNKYCFILNFQGCIIKQNQNINLVKKKLLQIYFNLYAR